MQIKSANWRAVIDSQSIPYDVVVNINDLTGASVVSFGGMTLESVSFDRALTSDMPENTRFTAGGYPAAGARIGLSGLVIVAGEYMAIDDFLNPWNTASPNYLIDWTSYRVTIDVRVYVDNTPDTTRVFTGEIDDLAIDHGSGGVTLTCVDLRSRMRSLPDLPNAYVDVAYTRSHSRNLPSGQPRSPADILNTQCLTSLYVIDYLFTKAGFRTTLPDRPGSLMRVSGHGGAFPEVYPLGQLDTPITDQPKNFTAGRYFPQLCGAYSMSVGGSLDSAITQYDPSANYIEGTNFGVNAGFSYECWVKDDGTSKPYFSDYSPHGATGYVATIMPGTFDFYNLQWGLSRVGGVLTPFAKYRDVSALLTTQTTIPTRTIPIDGNWHYVLVWAIVTSTSLSVTAWIDAQTPVSSVLALAAGTVVPSGVKMTTIIMESSTTTDSAQISAENTFPTLIQNTYVPPVIPDYDVSLNNLTAIPETGSLDAWGVVQKIAQAEQAVCGLNEYGVPFFTNRTALRTSASVREINSKNSLKSLGTRVARSAIATHVQVPVNGLAYPKTRVAVWSVSDYISLDPLETYRVIASFDAPSIGIGFFGAPIDVNGIGVNASGGTFGGWSQCSGYRASTTAAGGPAVTNLVMRVYQLSPTTALVTVYNPNAFTVYLVTPSTYTNNVGSPFLQIAGRPTIAASSAIAAATQQSALGSGIVADAQWPPADQGGAVSGMYGEVLLAVTQNSFIQSALDGQDLADDLLADLAYPRPILQNIAIMLDPSLQLGDRVTVVDPSRARISDDAQVFSINARLSANDAGMTVGARTVGTPGAWVMGITGKSEMGANTRV